MATQQLLKGEVSPSAKDRDCGHDGRFLLRTSYSDFRATVKMQQF